MTSITLDFTLEDTSELELAITLNAYNIFIISKVEINGPHDDLTLLIKGTKEDLEHYLVDDYGVDKEDLEIYF